MARVTVEDCVLKVPNRFELVLLAGQRARAVAAGAPLTVERDNDKNPVVALREIADETVSLEGLQNSLIKGLQKQVETDEPEEDREFEAEAVWSSEASGVAVGAEEEGIEAIEAEELQEDGLFAEEEASGEEGAEEGAADLPDDAVDDEL